MTLEQSLLLSSKKQAESYIYRHVGKSIFYGQDMYQKVYKLVVSQLNEENMRRLEVFHITYQNGQEHTAEQPHYSTEKSVSEMNAFISKYELAKPDDWQPAESKEVSSGQ